MITNKDIKYVIVQSGGKGTRLGKYTKNKPKCLVPVNDVPMIVNTLNVYRGKKVIVIGDYLFEVLRTYLSTFCSQYDYSLVETRETGTAAGIKEALELVPDNEPFIITWSDLFFEKEQEFSFESELLVGLSNTFKCRWRLFNNKFENIQSTTEGVSGFFAFKNKTKFENITTDKSLVRGFMCDNYSPTEIQSFFNHDCFEVGESDVYENLIKNKVKHRFFNEVKILDDKVYKKCIVSNYDKVFDKEKNWYDFIGDKYPNIPKVYSADPLVLQRVDGKHLWEVSENKEEIIKNYCDALDKLHSIDMIEASNKECEEVYYSKSISRIKEVQSIIRFVNQPTININGKDCLNPFYYSSQFENSVREICSIQNYFVVHGDSTFSNTLVDSNNKIWFIDPRGVFGSTSVYGDKRYDWAKFYYSAVGNYDSINSKQFQVIIIGDQVELEIKSNGYHEYGDLIIERSGMSEREMELIHSTIWLSLTGYVKEDIDSALYAFYKGCELWNKGIGRI